ncbi:MAG: cytochrome c3 family protein [Desulfobacteraceae bacterium]|nr:cytochrome c3 family protein [Desulfobacteraceae bacterium]
MWQRKRLVTGMAAALALLAVPLAKAETGPETVELDSLAKLYKPVSFNHSAHVEIAGGDCATCHHHTLGTGKIEPTCARCHAHSGAASAVACRDCHPAERFGAKYLQELAQDVNRYHRDKPGLKAAYHLRCLGCHRESGGPTGCQDCHAMTQAGEAFYRAGQYAPVPHAEGTEH